MEASGSVWWKCLKALCVEAEQGSPPRREALFMPQASTRLAPDCASDSDIGKGGPAPPGSAAGRLCRVQPSCTAGGQRQHTARDSPRRRVQAVD
jgi:hypothetical protein